LVTKADFERWLADSNLTSSDIGTFDVSAYLQTRTFVCRNFYLEDFECATILDSTTLSLLPQPFVPYHAVVPRDRFRIASTPNKGLAMFATKSMFEGDIILTESPIALFPVMAPTMQPPAHEFLTNRLGNEQRQTLLSLSNIYPPDACTKYVGIFRTNCIQVKLPIESSQPELASYHVGVFTTISRCNHRYEHSLNSPPRYIIVERVTVAPQMRLGNGTWNLGRWYCLLLVPSA
jgi:hypothetical protein